MSISTEVSRNDYVGNDVTRDYAYNYKINTETDLKVTVRSPAGVETLLTYSTEYSVSGAGISTGGEVRILGTDNEWQTGIYLKSGWALTIRRDPPITQETDIRNQGDFFPETHENAFDKSCMIAQKQQDEIDRSLKLAETIDPATFSTELPASIVGVSGASIITNSSGDGLEAGPTADAILAAQSNAEVAAASAAAALVSANDAAASAAGVNLPAITVSDAYKIPQVNTAGTGYEAASIKTTLAGNSDTDIPSVKIVKTTCDAKVALTGDQTVAGIKTLSSSPIVPTPTTDMQASTKKYVDDTKKAGYVKVSDTKTSNTAGGTFTSGAWRVRDITMENSDDDGLCSVSSNQITLAAGTYDCLISCPALQVNGHAARLYDYTNSTSKIFGTTEYSYALGVSVSSSVIRGRFTLASTTVLEIQHTCHATNSTYGFGTPLNIGGTVEVYTVAEFWKVG